MAVDYIDNADVRKFRLTDDTFRRFNEHKKKRNLTAQGLFDHVNSLLDNENNIGDHFVDEVIRYLEDFKHQIKGESNEKERNKTEDCSCTGSGCNKAN